MIIGPGLTGLVAGALGLPITFALAAGAGILATALMWYAACWQTTAAEALATS
jgi:TctA family transporter